MADPVALAREWYQAHEGLVWLDTVMAEEGSVSLLARRPLEILRGNLFQDAGDLRAALARGQREHPSGGLLGWVGFEGDYTFGYYEACTLWRHQVSGREDSASALVPTGTLPFQPQMDRATFCHLVERAQQYIAAGDIYQVNLSYPWLAEWPEGLDPMDFYLRLRETSPAPYGAFLDLGGTQVFSSSPECFLEMKGQRVTTKPIKGTRPRGATREEDKKLAEELTTSAKERAELVMITDLERNDLGQVCEYGSVRVTDLLKLERYAQVQHLVSTVEGTLRGGLDHLDAFLACFPGGSISGAPKKRALEIIQELEPQRRGLYTGAIGWLGFQGESRFNIAIRTAWREGKKLQFHTGAGIVADSDPAYEWEETQHKAAGLLRASGVTTVSAR